MNQILVVGEDALCCALGEKLVAGHLAGWRLAQEPVNCRGISRLEKRLPDYMNLARHVSPVLCVADTDGRPACELLLRWLPRDRPPNFHLRLAVTESESWLLADGRAFADYFAVPPEKMPRHSADALKDPKRRLLSLAKKSRNRRIREEVVSPDDPAIPGNGYNIHLCGFVRERWNAKRASEHSPSLLRAINRLAAFGRHAVQEVPFANNE